MGSAALAALRAQSRKEIFLLGNTVLRKSDFSASPNPATKEIHCRQHFCEARRVAGAKGIDATTLNPYYGRKEFQAEDVRHASKIERTTLPGPTPQFTRIRLPRARRKQVHFVLRRSDGQEFGEYPIRVRAEWMLRRFADRERWTISEVFEGAA